ncbi:hypothetical protein Hbl1158_06985 [Halobaculum sp. CBA1158]|uniref:HalOD1 output domain-containing protein n=1 Tax=Halobaculum sp. CBA1158 TaxID=2904243 RepID=UPI001F1F8DB4|nr:HalOD1 output domain-containing protein [Halobaculum sp. CBA1158]UIP01087.1 hypothetical protein Hbl1158_06985 [Halobaculum sp. CBA1158]
MPGMSADDSEGEGPKRSRPGSRQSIDVRVAEAVARAEGVDPTELKPHLYDAIDTEALDRVLESMEPDASVRFRFHGYRVVVRGDDTVSVDGDDS